MAAPTQFTTILFPEAVAREDGAGPAMDVSAAQSKRLEITLGITRIIEQESLDVSVWGSPDGVAWGAAPLGAFPQKFYCGVYSMTLDLSDTPDVRFLRVQWKMNRWGRGEPAPLFGFGVLAHEPAPALTAAGSR